MITADTASVYTDFQGLSKLKQGAREQSPEAVKEVAKQFESVFLGMMLKSMRQAKLGDGILDGKQSETFRDMYDQQMAVHLSGKAGMGLSDMLVKQLSPPQPVSETAGDSVADYLAKAVNSTGLPPRQAVAAYRASGQSMDTAGLSALERRLAQLESSQNNLAERWKQMDSIDLLGANDSADGLSANKQAFFDQLRPHAQTAAATLGVDANVLLAQAALETGWGQSVIKTGQGDSSYNLFNIKADRSWQGKQAKAVTVEFEDGVAKKQLAGFRAYDSYKQSFDDYVNFIKSNPRYGDALKQANNSAQYLQELQQAGYATDPQYANKILRIMNNRQANATLG
jgi:flagellar protein FlgJ